MKTWKKISFWILIFTTSSLSIINFIFYQTLYASCPTEFSSEGKCFNPEMPHMLDADSIFWLPVSIFFLILTILILFFGFKVKSVNSFNGKRNEH